MRHYELISVVEQLDNVPGRPAGQPVSDVGVERDTQLSEKASAVEDLKSLRLANEAAIAWVNEATRCATLTEFEVSLAAMQKLTATIQAGTQRIAAQEALLRKMEARHWPTDTARNLLETMRNIQFTMRQHRERVEGELGSKWGMNETSGTE